MEEAEQENPALGAQRGIINSNRLLLANSLYTLAIVNIYIRIYILVSCEFIGRMAKTFYVGQTDSFSF